MSDVQIRFGTNQGWECPKCGRVYAPWMSSCTFCGVDNNYIFTTNLSEHENISEKDKG